MDTTVLRQLIFSFFRIGLFTFGGGYAMLTLLEDEVVGKQKWLTNEEVLDLYAIGQTTPGVIMVNVATFIGFKQAGYLGAAVATAAVVAPSLIVMSVLVLLLKTAEGSPFVQKALLGVHVAVAAMLCAAVVRLWQKSVTNIFTAAILLGAFVTVQVWSVSAVVLIPLAALLGYIQWKWKSRG